MKAWIETLAEYSGWQGREHRCVAVEQNTGRVLGGREI